MILQFWKYEGKRFKNCDLGMAWRADMAKKSRVVLSQLALLLVHLTKQTSKNKAKDEKTKQKDERKRRSTSHKTKRKDEEQSEKTKSEMQKVKGKAKSENKRQREKTKQTSEYQYL